MRFVNISLVFVALIVLSGCDFFRVLAGRPTSAEIEELRVEIQRVEAEALKARLDSLERVRVQRSRDSLARLDSLAVVDSIVSKAGPIQTPEKYKGLIAGDVKARFYVIVGAFKSPTNAEAFRNMVIKRGYEADRFSFQNGLHAIGVCPSDHISGIHKSLKDVSSDRFFPKGVWVIAFE